MSKNDNLHDFLQDIGDAIKYKKGITDNINAQDFSTHIKTIDVGGAVNGVPDENKDVRFYDYDGTLLYSYTLDEVKRLEKLPTLPGHKGLIGQGWNWDYDDVIALDRPMNIGVNYITDDGKTRLYINIRAWSEHTCNLRYYQFKQGGVAIDWGDGSPIERTNLYGAVVLPHTYEKEGKYIITLTPDDDCDMYLGSTGPSVFNSSTNIDLNRKFSLNLYKVELGKNIKKSVAGINSFLNCLCMETITIPNYIEQIKFESCSAKCIVLPKSLSKDGGIEYFGLSGKFDIVCIPNGITNIPAECFNAAYSTNVTFPNSITEINSNCSGNHKLEKVIIPDNVKTLPDNMFQNCFNLKEVVLPNGLEMIPLNCFYDTRNMNYIDIPDKITEIGHYTCYRSMTSNKGGYCYIKLPYNLEKIGTSGVSDNDMVFIVFPPNLKELGYGALANCKFLTELIFPPNIESIDAYTFGNNVMMLLYDFTACKNIPTLANINTFTNISANTKILVPSNLYSDWINQDNWSELTKYIEASEPTEYDYESLMNKYYGNN